MKAYSMMADGERGKRKVKSQNEEWIKQVVELAVTGRLTEPIPVSVKPNYQNILDELVWICPNQKTACDKAPDLAFIPAELPIIIPLLIENRELALALIDAKRIFGGTIMDLSTPQASLNMLSWCRLTYCFLYNSTINTINTIKNINQ